MLPGVQVKSLIRVAEDQYTSQTLQQRQKIRETQTDRDLAGFYVYQNYLNRLRRLHRNYVKKYRVLQQQHQLEQQLQQQPGRNSQPGLRLAPQRSKQSLLLPNSNLKDEFSANTGLWPLSKSEWPITRFRLPASMQSEDLILGRDKYFDQSETVPSASASSLPPITPAPSPTMKNFQTISEHEEDDGEEKPIYIPCGRESSELRLQMLGKKQQQQRDRCGALSFRMWRRVHGKKETPYST